MTLVTNTYVGRPLERVEDARFLSGTGTFVNDMVRPGMLHAAILRSAVAHGRIVSIEVSQAMAMPGVHAVLTARDIGAAIPTIPVRLAPMPEFDRYVQPVIASTKVRYVGEPVAVVVADTRAIAEDALELIGLDVASLSPRPDRTAAATDASLLFEENGTNLVVHYDAQRGDAAAAFASADYTRRETFRSQRHAAVPMETRGLLAEWDEAAGRLIVSGASKVTFYNRRILAGMLGLAETAIHMDEVDVGGGFGIRGEFYPEDFLIPFAARRLGRPVKWIEDRREHLMASNHSRDIACELEIACRRDGTILGLRGRVAADMGAYIRTNGGIVPTKAGQFLPGPYRIPNVAVSVDIFVTSKTPVGTYRAPGRVEANFFRERLFDMAARDLGIDLVAFRRKNLITRAEMPYRLGKLVPYEPEAVFDSGDYHAALDRCLAEIGWDEKIALQGRRIDGRHHGLAVTSFVQSGGGGPRERARMVVLADGTVSVHVGASANGQGLETAYAQIAADALGLSLEAFRVLHGSTDTVSDSGGTYHSRSWMLSGSAVLDAGQKLLSAIRQAGALRLGCPVEAIRFVDGVALADTGGRVTLAELAQQAIAAGAPIEVEGSFAANGITWSYGAQAAHVAVDAGTGHVKVIDYVVVEDVGRVINPAIVHGQTIGAMVQGLGGVFLEHLCYDQDAQLLNASLVDYLMPTASDFPHLHAVTLQDYPSATNPLGAKGGSEGGNVATAATIANAVAAALSSYGVEPKELPLSPPRLWHLIEAARRARTAPAPVSNKEP